MRRHDLKYLSEIPIFSLLPGNELKKIAKTISVKNYPKGTTIAIQGETQIDGAFVIIKGSLALYFEKNGEKIMRGYYKQGEIFGGITILLNSGMSLRTVIADEDCSLYRIPKDVFIEICTRFAPFYKYYFENFGKNILDESLNLFVKEQVKKWEDRDQSRIPVITVSSEPGSGGYIVAQQIAKQLKIDIFQRELIQEIAESADVNTAVIDLIEKTRMSGIQDFISSLINDHYLWPGLYLEHLKKVVGVIEKHGQAVIVGRGANFILPPEKRLSVRIISPLKVRAQNVARTFGVSYETAKRRVLRRESKRKDFIRRSFQADIADPLNYDLIINMGKLKIGAAVGSVIGALEDGLHLESLK